jgi:Zn-dependent peptidase ImmA (M78 family)/transcriptional regulator with XRE-family HTH domain
MSRPSTKEFFIRERLTEARDARGLTQADLADSLQRSRFAISNWERGEQAPEPALLEQLASVLGVPTGYFRKPIPEHGNGAVFFRSLANATARARTRERARVRWLQHISLTLQGTLDFPAVSFPQLLLRGDYKKLENDDLEQIADAVRKHWKLGDGPIKNMVLVAENAGAVVGVDETGSTKIDGQGNWSNADRRPYILLASDKYTAFRRQMDAAHELAHLILHYGVSEEELEQNFEKIEDQAKYLACALLLPHRSFPAEVFSLSLDGFLSLKAKWRVSVGAMIMRAHQLEMLSDAAAQRLWKYRATRGWHRREPLDLPSETPVEEPRLLRRSIEMIVEAKVKSKSELLQSDICLGARDVEQLAALPAHYFFESASIVAIEPRLKQREGTPGQGTVVPLRKPS